VSATARRTSHDDKTGDSLRKTVQSHAPRQACLTNSSRCDDTTQSAWSATRTSTRPGGATFGAPTLDGRRE
jgi:hypothetical protein